MSRSRGVPSEPRRPLAHGCGLRANSAPKVLVHSRGIAANGNGRKTGLPENSAGWAFRRAALDLPDDQALSRSLHDGFGHFLKRVDFENPFHLREQTTEQTEVAAPGPTCAR